MTAQTRKNFGDDLLVSTSVHLRVGTLKQLRELFPKSGSSRFIRESVEEKLSRDGGLKSTILRMLGERDALHSKLANLDSMIEQLRKESVELDKANLETQRRTIISDALSNVTYASSEAAFDDLKPVLKIQDKKEEIFVKALVDEEWSKRNVNTQQ